MQAVKLNSVFRRLWGRSEPPSATSAAGDPLQVTRKQLLALRHQATLLTGQKPRQVRSNQSGGYLSRFRGRGSEFDEVRPYQAGDDTRDIDWRVSARTGRTYTKLFREERECPVMIGVDLRQPMHFGTRVCFKSHKAMEIAALLAWMAEHQGDRIGATIFNEAVHHELRPKRGQKAVLHLIQQLLDQQQPASSDKTAKLSDALLRLQRIAKTGSRIYLVSDFHDLDEEAIKRLNQISRHNEVVAILVYDPLESTLPNKGRYVVTDGQNKLTVDSSQQALLAEHHYRFELRLQRLDELMRANTLQLITLATSDEIIPRLRGVRR